MGGVFDIGMPHVTLYCTGVLALVGEIESGAVAEHVWMDGEIELGLLASSGDDVMNSSGGEWGFPFTDKDVG